MVRKIYRKPLFAAANSLKHLVFSDGTRQKLGGARSRHGRAHTGPTPFLGVYSW